MDLSNIRLRLLDFGGSGSPVLILHGLAGRASEWSEVASRLAASHRVVALDLRGHGGSDKPPDDFARDSFAGDAVAALEALALGQACMLGHSFGGDIALTVAATRGDLLSSLIVVEAAPHLDLDTRMAIADWFRSWPIRFESLDEARTWFVGAGLQHPEMWLAGLKQSPGGYQPDFRTNDMANILEGTEEDIWHLLPKIKAPTLLITGDDGLVPDEDVDRMVRTIPRARHERMHGTGHNVHLDDPATCGDLIEAFLEGLEQGVT